MNHLQSEYLRGARRKAQQTDYFDDGDSDDGAAGSASSSSRGHNAGSGGAAAGEEEVDPLDAFMQNIDAQVVQERSAPRKPSVNKVQTTMKETKQLLLWMIGADTVALFSASMKKPRLGLDLGGDDSDEEVYATAKRIDDGDAPADEMDKKVMEVLAPVDYAAVHYEPFRKAFYTPHGDIAALSNQEVAALRKELSVRVEGSAVSAPVRSFMHLGFDRKMLAMLMKLGLEAPTAIQAQAFPVALAGRDLIGIAKTGSGKTLAFTLPMVRHVMDQRELQRGEGPIAVVLAPTRELAHQTFVQAKKFLGIYGASCAAIYGGAGKWEQVQALRKGAEVVVATPGRLIEMIRKKTAPMSRVTFVVLDEADRMFEMGFEPQLRSVMGQIRPDRQTLMFSATFRRRVEALALDVLENPVKLTIGQVGQANEDIRQVAVVLPGHGAKWPWLMAHLRRLVDEGRLLIFAGSKAGCEELAKNLASAFPAAPARCLHGDKSQQERSEALAMFKSGECRVLVATDVAARGLDVKNVKNVVNFDVAKNIDTHVHRIGRTGRMGTDGFEPGTAYTLVTRKETQFAAQLVYNMDVSSQVVSAELLALAQGDPRFRRGGAAARAPAQYSSGGNGDWMSVGSVRGASGDQLSQQSVGALASGEGRHLDAEDAAEMERWSDSRRKSKADQRRGLGFAGAASGGTTRRSGAMSGFVKASTSSSSLATAFQSGFVKSTLSPPAATAPPPPSSVSTTLPPPPPPPPAAVMHLRPPLELRIPPPPPPVVAAANVVNLMPPPPAPVLVTPAAEGSTIVPVFEAQQLQSQPQKATPLVLSPSSPPTESQSQQKPPLPFTLTLPIPLTVEIRTSSTLGKCTGRATCFKTLPCSSHWSIGLQVPKPPPSSRLPAPASSMKSALLVVALACMAAFVAAASDQMPTTGMMAAPGGRFTAVGAIGNKLTVAGNNAVIMKNNVLVSKSDRVAFAHTIESMMLADMEANKDAAAMQEDLWGFLSNVAGAATRVISNPTVLSHAVGLVTAAASGDKAALARNALGLAGAVLPPGIIPTPPPAELPVAAPAPELPAAMDTTPASVAAPATA
ncbi:hypothetical protein BBJ28_00009434 [Nothophytophthora sp. Chile5]|nr:hypothetical protein BBJ28_00009434 [Nothophytophthora sp. Chile5]